MKKLKAGIIGVGFIGPIHMEAIRRLGHDVAICEVNEELAKAAAEKYVFGQMHTNIVAAKLGNDAGIVGAALCASRMKN